MVKYKTMFCNKCGKRRRVKARLLSLHFLSCGHIKQKR